MLKIFKFLKITEGASQNTIGDIIENDEGNDDCVESCFKNICCKAGLGEYGKCHEYRGCRLNSPKCLGEPGLSVKMDQGFWMCCDSTCALKRCKCPVNVLLL